MAFFSNSKFDAMYVIRSQTEVGSKERITAESGMGRMVFAMVSNYARHPFFNGYPEAFRADMIAEGVFAIWVKLDGFDREKGTNYFSYFTSVAKNAFLNQLRIYYKKRNQNVPLDVIDNFLTED